MAIEPLTVTQRRELIISLLEKKPITNQTVLAEALAGYGVQAAQATLSRDLKALRVAKVATETGYRLVGGVLPASPEAGFSPQTALDTLLSRIQALEEAVFGRSQS